MKKVNLTLVKQSLIRTLIMFSIIGVALCTKNCELCALAGMIAYAVDGYIEKLMKYEGGEKKCLKR